MRTRIGHYEIAQELGRGGMGVVYKGFESALNRFVAIKTLSESLAHDPSIVERFMREAKSMASLNDPHIIQIYFVGEDQGQPFFAMEFVEGESLSQKLKREGRIPASVACQILLQTAQGLTTAHDRGVIHRDIKPANLMITTRGLIKVADFGIALATQDFSKKLTSTGEFVGTPGYLSPEVCMGKSIDPRSDIFSLGIVFFEMLTGRIPFNDASPLGLMLEVVQADIPDVRTLNAEVDANVHAILTRMVAKEPHHRYQDCHQLIEDLVAIGTSTVGGLQVKPLSAQVVIPPPAQLPSGRQSLPSGAVAAPPPPMPLPPQTPAPVARMVQTYGATAISSPNMAHPQPQVPPPQQVYATQPQYQPQPAPHAARRGSVLPWAIAATLLLGGTGFAGWHFRDKLGFGSGGAGTTTADNSAKSATPPASTVAPVANTGAPATATTAPITLSSADPGTTTGTSATAASTPATGTAQVPTAEAVPATGAESGPDMSAALAEMQAATRQLEQARLELEKSKAETLAQQGTPAQAEAEADTPTLSGPAPRTGQVRSNLERLGGRVNARAQVAQATPMGESRNMAKSVPTGRVLVIAYGHPGAAAVARSALASSIGNAGYSVVGPDLVSGVARAQERAPDLPAIARIAANAGIDVIVAAHIEVTGVQRLDYYGQSSDMFTSLITVKSYAVGARSQLGEWQEQLNFTPLNVLDNTREAMQPHLGALTRTLVPYKARG